MAGFVVLLTFLGPIPLAARGLTAVLARAGPGRVVGHLLVVRWLSAGVHYKTRITPDDDGSIVAGGDPPGVR